MKLLVFEDEPEIAHFVERVGKSKGYEVSKYRSPLEFFGKLHVNAVYDLSAEEVRSKVEGITAVITDGDMPGMSGADLIDRLRNAGATMPIAMFTGQPGAYSDTILDLAIEYPQTIILCYEKPIKLFELTGFLAKAAKPSS
jgi:DNA-binding response OmpR family regulator